MAVPVSLSRNEKQAIEELEMRFQNILSTDLREDKTLFYRFLKAADMFLQVINILQNNYPERLKLVYIINAPAYFPILFSILKTIMSNAMIQKIHVFARDGWKDELLKKIDADVLPAFLGGNRTDPDGNPMCHTFIFHGGPIPPKYFLSPEDRTFKIKSKVEQVKIPHKSSFKIPVEVKIFGSVIQWEFEVKSKDIGFGLFFRQSEDLEEILPIQRFITNDGTEEGSFRSQSIGMYIIVFDNSHSSFSSKEVCYCITVEEPK